MKNDQNKSRIDRIRESAGSFTVGDETDGAIVAMATIGSKLYTIKEHAVYAISMADDIDPQRTREDIPNTVQKIFNAGSQSEVVQRLLLTGAGLFKKDRLVNEIDYDEALRIVLAVTGDLIAASQVLSSLEAMLANLDLANIISKSGALTLPSVPGLEADIKNFVQKMDHAMQGVFNLTAVFYDEAALRKAGKWLDGFASYIESLEGAQSDYVAFARELATLGKQARNVRHCIEHPDATKRLDIADFSLNAKAELLPPTITVVHQATPFDATPVSEFMRYFVENSLQGVEILMAFLASRHVAEIDRLQIDVGEIPEDQRRLGVRFGYLVNFGGTIVKLG